MCPQASSEHVRQFMSKQRTENTTPEVQLRKCLHALGVRFRLHRRSLPGTPDIVLPRLKLAIFVDGCFWHGCPEHGNLPKSNREWWRKKLRANAERDRKVESQLRDAGWEPLRVWEHEDPVEVAESIAERWHAAVE